MQCENLRYLSLYHTGIKAIDPELALSVIDLPNLRKLFVGISSFTITLIVI